MNFVYFCSMKQLSDDEIIEGFRKGDDRVVKDYFYPYCQMAYVLLDRRYDLRGKMDMEFMSLAHEYYLRLVKDDFRQLHHRETVSLRTWMANGFRFLVLDRLKAINAHRIESFEERLEHGSVVYDVTDDTLEEDFRNTVQEICTSRLGHDRKNRLILYGILVDGYKGKEIATQLGISPGTVTVRYQRMMEDIVKPYFRNYFVASESMAQITPVPRAITAFNRSIKAVQAGASRTTPDYISSLAHNEIFVFGSDLAGLHVSSEAKMAMRLFGAVKGHGSGLQGRSYAIPTMQGGTDSIKPYVDRFINYAREHQSQHFLVTRIGCGIAGFESEDIAPLFADAIDVTNIALPKDFWKVLLMK